MPTPIWHKSGNKKCWKTSWRKWCRSLHQSKIIYARVAKGHPQRLLSLLPKQWLDKTHTHTHTLNQATKLTSQGVECQVNVSPARVLEDIWKIFAKECLWDHSSKGFPSMFLTWYKLLWYLCMMGTTLVYFIGL